jgi:hypothetical protein
MDQPPFFLGARRFRSDGVPGAHRDRPTTTAARVGLASLVSIRTDPARLIGRTRVGPAERGNGSAVRAGSSGCPDRSASPYPQAAGNVPARSEATPLTA